MTEDVKQEETQGEKEREEKPIDKMTAKELREIAKDIPGVTGVHAMKKEELLAIIKEARGIKDEAPAKKKRVKAAKTVYTVHELKMKIVQLKEEKAKAREARDKDKIEALRRRINRMKKMSRKIAQA